MIDRFIHVNQNIQGLYTKISGIIIQLFKAENFMGGYIVLRYKWLY